MKIIVGIDDETHWFTNYWICLPCWSIYCIIYLMLIVDAIVIIITFITCTKSFSFSRLKSTQLKWGKNSWTLKWIELWQAAIQHESLQHQCSCERWRPPFWLRLLMPPTCVSTIAWMLKIDVLIYTTFRAWIPSLTPGKHGMAANACWPAWSEHPVNKSPCNKRLWKHQNVLTDPSADWRWWHCSHSQVYKVWLSLLGGWAEAEGSQFKPRTDKTWKVFL